MTRTQRVWQMIVMLRERPYTDGELADLFQVSARTIRADRLLIATEPFYQNIERKIVFQIVPVRC